MGLIFQRIGLVLQRIRLVFQIIICLKDQMNYYLNPLRACPPSVRHSYGEIHSQQTGPLLYVLISVKLLPSVQKASQIMILLFFVK
jgi:hypothetical protein